MKVFMLQCDRCGKRYEDLPFSAPIYTACRRVDGILVEIDLCEDCLAILANFVENVGGKKDA